MLFFVIRSILFAPIPMHFPPHILTFLPGKVVLTVKVHRITKGETILGTEPIELFLHELFKQSN